jgi:hypothetical protein
MQPAPVAFCHVPAISSSDVAKVNVGVEVAVAGGGVGVGGFAVGVAVGKAGVRVAVGGAAVGVAVGSGVGPEHAARDSTTSVRLNVPRQSLLLLT